MAQLQVYFVQCEARKVDNLLSQISGEQTKKAAIEGRLLGIHIGMISDRVVNLWPFPFQKYPGTPFTIKGEWE